MYISIEERLQFYLGDMAWSTREPFEAREIFDMPFLFDARRRNKSRAHYDPDIQRLVGLSERKQLWFQCGDRPYTGPHYPVLVKTRDTFLRQSKGVIANLNSGRHWDLADQGDLPWHKKHSEIFWRGVDTGNNMQFNLRLMFVEAYFGRHNVGFSHYAQCYKRAPHLFQRKWKLGLTPRPEFLKFKYLPVIDGNDKASSLNWILASNSIPLMPKPRFHSWLCEHLLRPNVHYVELKYDYSDLDEVLAWCRANDDQCREIARNGQEFIANFIDPQVEQAVERQMVSQVEEHLERCSDAARQLAS